MRDLGRTSRARKRLKIAGKRWLREREGQEEENKGKAENREWMKGRKETPDLEKFGYRGKGGKGRRAIDWLIEGRKIDYCKRWAEESKGEAIWKKEEGYGRKRKKEIERKEDGGDGGGGGEEMGHW
jgi:hypothetical protein